MPKLVVKNFINIRRAEINLDKKLIVFIGETASGKSVLAQLLYLFQEVMRDFRRHVKRLNTAQPEHLQVPGNELSSVFRKLITDKFHSFFGDVVKIAPAAADAAQKKKADAAQDAAQERAAAPINGVPFEILYFYLPESCVKLTLSDAETLDITLPEVMGEVEQACHDILTQMRNVEKRQTRRAERKKAGLPPEDSEKTASEKLKQESREELHYILNMTLGISDITDKLVGKYRNSLLIPADRNIAANYPDALRRIFYGGIRSALQTRKVPRSRASLHLIAQFLEKNEEYLNTFSDRHFQSLFQDRINEDDDPDDYDAVDQPMVEFLLQQIAILLKDERSKVADIKKSKLFSEPTGEGSLFLESASSGQQHLLRILQDGYMSLLYDEAVFRVIEEPEAHVHPLKQKHLIYVIALMSNQLDSKHILTTHSPYILAVLKNLLTLGRLAKKDPTAAMDFTARVPELCWLDPKNVEVYHIKNGTSRPMVRPRTEPILENPLAQLLTEFESDLQLKADI